MTNTNLRRMICPVGEWCPQGRAQQCHHTKPHDAEDVCLRAGCLPSGHQHEKGINWDNIVCVEVPDVAV